MPTPTDILVAYGAMCLTVIVIGLLAVLTVAVYDWLADRRVRSRDRHYATGNRVARDEIDALFSIPHQGEWPSWPNQFDRETWSP
ncbi:MAG TPA: hypothetical protein VK631_20725 [Solirubrobacteraceae bacterium]|nr:hypothetical protein [Solirubrobacteraceae bacterium]